MELNPRFGGGYPFSHAAGANVPSALIAWRRGLAPKPEWLRVRPGVLSAKDRAEIERTIAGQVLDARRFPSIDFRSTRVESLESGGISSCGTGNGAVHVGKGNAGMRK